MLKNKNTLLFTLILFCSNFVQADWGDTLRWLQNNAKRHATTKKVAAVVGVAALCAIGIGCWWKLRQPAKPDEDIRYAFRRRLLNKGEYAEYQMSEDKAQGYKLFSLYYTGQDKKALDHLLNNDIAKTQHIMDGFFDYSQQAGAMKGNYFKKLFQDMSGIVRKYNSHARIAAGMIFVDGKNNTLYVANIGNIAISNNKIHNLTKWYALCYHQDVTDKYLGQELSLPDVQVKVLTLPIRLCGEIVIEKQSTEQIAAIPFESITLGNDEMIDVVKTKDVALAVKWWQ